MPVTPEQLTRLQEAIVQLLEQVQNTNQLVVRQTICELYYRQKAYELELVCIHFEDAQEAFGGDIICSFYKGVFYQWRRDVRWLNRFKRMLPVL